VSRRSLRYEPRPLHTCDIKLPVSVLRQTELLARHNHDVWAKRRVNEGWVYGPNRDDVQKEHPNLVPYEELPESEKEIDRKAVLETLKAIIALGFSLNKISS